MKKVDVPTKPGRLINAVANMGYDPEVALCDLIDNCIDAQASNIDVVLEKESQEEEGLPATIGAYIIADDGIGMDEQTLIGAFTLGTERDYPSGSLGKFGLGLKSAGLSLGREIILLTAQENQSPLCAQMSIEEVEQSGEYQIDLGPIPDHLAHYWADYGLDKGTVLIIRELNDSRPSYEAFAEYLGRHCAIIYHRFLEREEPRVAISVNSKQLTGFDPLFLNEAAENGPLEGDPANWDGKTVQLLMKDGSLPLLDASPARIDATHLVHPPSFKDKRHDTAQRYAVDTDPYTRRPRHGFYVYRNQRVIVLAERFHGLVGNQTQNWAFRARLMFNETADAVLSLDVKKRHCQLPKKTRQNLKVMIGLYQTKSVEAWKAAGKRLQEEKKETKDDRANESIVDTPVSSLVYSPGGEPLDEASVAKRRNIHEDLSNEAIEAIHDDNVDKELLDKRAQEGDIVTKVQGLRSNAMWMAYPAVSVGRAETLVNALHSWVAEAYNASEEEPSVAIVLHQLFTILARAELDVRSTDWPDLSDEVMKKVFDRYRKRVSTIGEDLAEHLEAALTENSIEDEQ